jgi:predicted regulator of Ras-like GTPase activity (Roadblock/LC7/MglB family)
MADPSVAKRSREASPEASAQALARFTGTSAEVRGCAILGPDGVMAASGSEARWADAARALLDAADAAAGGSATHAHVATEEGEVYAVRSGELAIVAVTSRYTLASLVFADMRAALRGAREAAPAVTAEAA